MGVLKIPVELFNHEEHEERQKEKGSGKMGFRFDALSNQIIGCAIEVHRHLVQGCLSQLMRNAWHMSFPLIKLSLKWRSHSPLNIRGLGLIADIGLIFWLKMN